MNTESDHLYFDGAHYDAKHWSSDDVPFWIAQAKRHLGPLLELGCGTGRLTIPLTREEVAVTGIDFSDSMLCQARRNAKDNDCTIKLIKADIRAFELGEKFKLIILPVNTLCHILSLDDLARMLECVRKHAQSNAHFIIDIFNPQLSALVHKPDKKFKFGEYPHPNGKGRVTITATGSYDRASQVNTLRLRYNMDGETIQDELKMRIYFPMELEGLLCLNGFSIQTKFGDYNEVPFHSESPRQIIVTRLGCS